MHRRSGDASLRSRRALLLLAPRDGRVIEQTYTIPQHVALGGLDQESLLPDGEVRFGTDSDEVSFERLDDVVVIAAQIRERRPRLPLPVDSLTLVFSDIATRRWPRGRGVLDATAHADIVDHLASVSPPNQRTSRYDRMLPSSMKGADASCVAPVHD